jgi:hypothetical protein
MSDTFSDLRTIVETVQIVSPTRYTLAGQPREVAAPPEGATASEVPLVAELQRDMYVRLYTRSQAGPAGAGGFVDELGARQFIAALSAANSGRGTWEPGWVIQGPMDEGQVPVRKDGLTLWVTSEQLRSRGGTLRPGARCRIRIGKELRELMRGFYVAIGDGDERDEQDDDEITVRFYWHVRHTGAVEFIAGLTSTLNHLHVPFRAKVVSHPSGYPRADSGVLYLGKRHYPRVAEALPALHERLAPHLQAPVPMFAKPLAPGLGLAEDPGTEESFGQHRCRLITEALWHAFAAGIEGTEERVAAVARALEAQGFQPRSLYLQPRSADGYVALGEALDPAAFSKPREVARPMEDRGHRRGQRDKRGKKDKRARAKRRR